MKRMLISSVMAVSLVAIAAAQATQQASPPPQQQQQAAPPQTPVPQVPATKAEDVTLVGCVVQGSAAKIYLFENAVDPAKKDDIPRKFVLVLGPDMDLTTHLNHKIQLVGVAETKVVKVVPPATVVAEKDLPTFTIKTITHIADTCSASMW